MFQSPWKALRMLDVNETVLAIQKFTSCVESRFITFPINIRKGPLTTTYDGHIVR